MMQAHAAQDSAEVWRLAHKLIGSASVLGLSGLVSNLRAVENAATLDLCVEAIKTARKALLDLQQGDALVPHADR